jgi:glycosyltransferase involved in cell wall biosynthesis
LAYLWLTLCDPDPQTNGQFIYSGGLIRAVARAGVELSVLGLSRQPDCTHRRREGNIDWQLAADRPLNRWARTASPFPAFSQRTRVPDMQAALAKHLATGRWDAVVLDSINVGWALPHILRYRRRHPRTKIAYLAQNDETAAACAVAKAQKGWRRAVRLADVAKTRWLEGRLLRTADLVTADSPEDCRALAALSPGRPVVFVSPGYAGARVSARTIDSRLPRRAIVVGSFDWPAKRLSLDAFLSTAAPLFAANGIGLQIVGRTESSHVAALRKRFPSVEVVGTVSDVRPYMAEARIALVPDVLGGFKLKSLDYIFNRLPIFAMNGAVPGTPLTDGRGIRLFKSHGDLARGVVDMIDDTASLDEQQQVAYALSTDCFDWNVIGQGLVRQIQAASIERTRIAETSEDYFVAKSARGCSSGCGQAATVRGD